jgi:hypothetical protein
MEPNRLDTPHGFIVGFIVDVTQLMNALEQGDPHAVEELLPLVYQELRKLAAQRTAHQPVGFGSPG